MDLAVAVHEVTRSFPRDETFGLTSQVRRSSYSVPLNIAEGHSRMHRKEYLNHLSIARGSLSESETALELAGRLGYSDADTLRKLHELCGETGRLLNGLIRSLSEAAPDP